jgi:plastocyanin
VTPVAPSGAAVRHDESTIAESPIVESSDASWTLGESDDAWTLDDWTSGGATTLEATASPLSAPASGELMTFGNPTVGSPFPPAVHDKSYHARDNIIPGTVVIDAGQVVTFHVYPGHRVAIYKPGKRPEDVNVNFFPGPFVLDPVQRLALQAVPVPFIGLKFNTPGRYLVICAVKSHFVLANMYGWVIVR